MGSAVVYKILTAGQWRAARAANVFRGSLDDWRDGFIHLSTREQVAETARRHFADAGELRVLVIDAARLGESLKWEPSRGGDLFPHLYGDLPLSAVERVERVARSDAGDGDFVWPSEIAV